MTPTTREQAARESDRRQAMLAVGEPDRTPLDRPTRTARVVNGDVEMEINAATGEVIAERSLIQAFRPIATLRHERVTVEFRLACGRVCLGWLIHGLARATDTYWHRVSPTTLEEVTPVAWRHLPYPIAHRSAA